MFCACVLCSHNNNYEFESIKKYKCNWFICLLTDQRETYLGQCILNESLSGLIAMKLTRVFRNNRCKAVPKKGPL